MQQGKGRRRRMPAEARRQDLVAAAMEIIRNHGVAKLTTRSLSQAVGVAQPTLFLHFGNKANLLVAVVDAIEERLRAGLGELPLEEMAPLERLETVIRFHLRFIEDQPGIPRLLFSEDLQTDPLFHDRMRRLVGFFQGFLADLIAEGRDSGALRGDLDPERHAFLLIAAVQGLAFRWVLSGNAFTLSARADELIATLLEGWRPR